MLRLFISTVALAALSTSAHAGIFGFGEEKKPETAPAAAPAKAVKAKDPHAAHKGHHAASPAASTTKLQAATKHMHHAMNIRYTGDYDTDFVRGMIPHHKGAVDMANTVLKQGRDPEIRKLAKWIIEMQKLEIATMKHWLATRGSTAYTKGSESEKAYTKAMRAMHKGMDITPSGNADVDFARGMIPHHQGAVDMAWVLKKHGRDPQLQQLADDILQSQRQEIAQMKEWLEKRKK